MKPLTTREAYELFKLRSSPQVRSEMEALLETGRLELELDEKRAPDVIVGGDWPSEVVGSRREKCAHCGRFVSISPLSGMVVKERFPDVPVICFPCARTRALKEETH